MAHTRTGTTVITLEQEEEPRAGTYKAFIFIIYINIYINLVDAGIYVRLRRPRERIHRSLMLQDSNLNVRWAEGTVDNENLQRRNSKSM